ncbi:hypothetical protein [Mesorhizobium sp. CN2-181]|uniref:hypothetical protein n=1 Tax=Mesorhizobium yinganensis TaxID=3157707 RepID=UPI0032B75F14
MAEMRLSLALLLLLVVSLAGKSINFARDGEIDADDSAAITAYLEARGLAVQPLDLASAPLWIVGTRGDCRMRVTDVAPEGWSRTIIAEQTAGENLTYAFAGAFFAEQPAFRTQLEKYRRRLVRYAGFQAPELKIRAIAVAPACPPDLVRPEDAALLSQ